MSFTSVVSAPQNPPGKGQPANLLMPFALHDAAVAELSDMPYMFGGRTENGDFSSALYRFHISTNYWELTRTGGDGPSRRSGASLNRVRNFLVLFGGENSEGAQGDTYIFDPTSLLWMRGKNQQDAAPEPRSKAATTSDGMKVYIFGGLGEGGRFLSDFWMIDFEAEREGLELHEFAIRFHSIQAPNRGIGKFGATLTYIDKHLFLYGGYGSGGLSDELWIFSLATEKWVKAPVFGIQPPLREGHFAGRNGNDLIIAAGCDSRRSAFRCYNDVWKLNIASMRWSLVLSTKEAFLTRQNHGGVILSGGTMYLFGGCNIFSQFRGDVPSIQVEV